MLELEPMEVHRVREMEQEEVPQSSPEAPNPRLLFVSTACATVLPHLVRAASQQGLCYGPLTPVPGGRGAGSNTCLPKKQIVQMPLFLECKKRHKCQRSTYIEQAFSKALKTGI